MNEQPSFTQYFPPVLEFCGFVKTRFGLSSWSPIMQNFNRFLITPPHSYNTNGINNNSVKMTV